MFPTIQAAAEAIRQGRAAPIDLLEQCLRQVEKYEEKVKAWVFIATEEARQQAQRLTDELKVGHCRGPLHGIPIGIKDIIDVADWPTAAGSKLWANSIAREDAALVAKLRQAGAIIMGKTVTTQYASFDPPPTRNPWNLERTPGGSSSGSAAAVACGMCLGAIGTQTGGSITRPAAYCGVASCKPAFGRVSTEGVLPLAKSMDHPGPMARCVWDLAAILQAIISVPLGEEKTLAAQSRGKSWPSPLRFGRLRGIFDEKATEPVRTMMTEVENQFRKKGAVIEEVDLPAEFCDVLPRHHLVMAVEGAAYHEQRLKQHPEDYKPNITKLLQQGLSCPAPEYARAKEHQKELKFRTSPLFCNADVLLTPAATSPAPDIATTGDPAFNSPWSYTGMPTVSIPAGWSPEGLPLSIQLVGHIWSEEQSLFAAAAWCEAALDLPLRYPPI